MNPAVTVVPGQTVSNLVVAAVGPDGKVAIHNSAGSTAVWPTRSAGTGA